LVNRIHSHENSIVGLRNVCSDRLKAPAITPIQLLCSCRRALRNVFSPSYPQIKIGGVSQLVFRRLREFDYLGVEGGFEVPWGVSWEKYFFHDFVLRKKVTDRDWSKSELFESMPVIALFCNSPIDESELRPCKTPKPPADR
jgi:hypothetical protein